MSGLLLLDRRELIFGGGALAGTALLAPPQSSFRGVQVSIAEFGAVAEPGHDNSRAIQQAIDTVSAKGGGLVLVPGTYECGVIRLADGVTIRGAGGLLVNARIIIPEGRQQCGVEKLGIVDRRADSGSFALDVAGSHCSFEDLALVKDPIAGGYQAYVRQTASHCRFSGLTLKGSNGIMVAGHDHLFERFDLRSTMSNRVGGDDAFAIKAPGRSTYNLTIRNGIVRGFAAIASFGSEVGTEGALPDSHIYLRNVAISDVEAKSCGSLVFFKPGALIYDWRNGLIEDVRLERLRLTDERGERFTCGVRMIAARGATIRNVTGKLLEVRARAKNQGVQPTAAIDLSLLDRADARFDGVDLQMRFTDPYAGAPHGPEAPGYPVDHIVRIEKTDPRAGSMRNIALDVEGRGSRFGGVYIGAGLDDAITLRRAHLSRVGLHPPASVGGGGIWSESRLRLGDIRVDSPILPRFGGHALAGGRRP
ncbi:hypothetical protein [Sphingomonas sp. URHD0057]|uniref:hypothetical protein n=1 Tax=Sphingomonas sp. URHD0057 TaxID=1380389 RepID=UPI00048BC506|nr:hypothetical protein [Sphingomonas sp. URHD0057]